MDALAIGSVVNCNSSVNGSYGNTVIAGSTTTIKKIEFVLDSFFAINNNIMRVKVSSGSPASTGGTVLGTFTQESVTASASDGSNKYLVSFTGSAAVTQGNTYYIQISYISSGSGQSLCLSDAGYTAASGWSIPTVGSEYVMVLSGGTFNWYIYHKIRITTGDVFTSADFNSIQLPGNSLTAVFESATTITASVAAPSKVTFFSSGKRIAKCIKVSTTGTAPNITATCVWKPSRRGSVTVSAQSYPVDSGLSSARSATLNVSVLNRTTKR